APGGEPIGPAQVKPAIWCKDLVNRIEELVWFGQVFEYVGADDEVILAERRQVVPVDIDLAKRCLRDFGQEKILLVRKTYLTAALHQLCPEYPMTETQI